jgi:hypothetical protein
MIAIVERIYPSFLANKMRDAWGRLQSKFEGRRIAATATAERVLPQGLKW